MALAREPVSELVDRGLIALVLGGVLCLGIALGLEIFPHASAHLLAPARLEPSERRPQGEALLSPLEPGPVTCRELFQILSPRRADPAAVKFLEEFMAREPLRKIYQDYAAGVAERPAQEFIQALQRSKEFGSLVRSHSRDPAFRSVAEALTRHPMLKRLLRGMPPLSASTGIRAPRSAPDRSADPVGAERRGRDSPVGAIRAPGKPVNSPRLDR